MPYRTKALVVSPCVATLVMPALGLCTVLRNRNYFVLFRFDKSRFRVRNTADCVCEQKSTGLCARRAPSPRATWRKPFGPQASRPSMLRKGGPTSSVCCRADPRILIPDPGLKRGTGSGSATEILSIFNPVIVTKCLLRIPHPNFSTRIQGRKKALDPDPDPQQRM
jgi:hypothetical protein